MVAISTQNISGFDTSPALPDGCLNTSSDINKMTAVNGVTTSIASNTTAALVSGLTIPTTVLPGTYVIQGKIIGTADAGAGIKIGLGGTAIVSSMGFFTRVWNAGSVVGTPSIQTTFNSTSGNTAVYTDIDFAGSITVSQAGTVGLLAAQNASSATATTISPYSTLWLERAS